MAALLEARQRPTAPLQDRQNAAAIRKRGKGVAALFHAGQDKTILAGTGYQFVPAIEQQMIQSFLIERPVAHRPGVDMKKTRVRIPPNPAALQSARSLHCPFVVGVDANIERASVDVLTVLGDAEMGARQHRIGLTRSVGREYGRARGSYRVHDAGEKVENADID